VCPQPTLMIANHACAAISSEGAQQRNAN
jgi:hypothetical protein